MGRKLVNHCGEQWNAWLIIEKCNYKDYYICECSCGKRNKIRYAQLKNGGSKSCRACANARWHEKRATHIVLNPPPVFTATSWWLK